MVANSKCQFSRIYKSVMSNKNHKKLRNSLYRKTLFPVKTCFLSYYSVSHSAAMPRRPGGVNKTLKSSQCNAATDSQMTFIRVFDYLKYVPLAPALPSVTLCWIIMQSVKHEWGINGPTHESEWGSSVKRNRKVESLKSQVESELLVSWLNPSTGSVYMHGRTQDLAITLLRSYLG